MLIRLLLVVLCLVSVAAQGASFRCDGRTHCSEMTSCAEATYFIQHCPNTKMDGNNDGVPCENLQLGDTVSFYGEYVWNEKGGVIHWTHHDPAGKHKTGWVRHNGERYQ